GEVIAVGTPEEVMANPHSVTGAYLSGNRRIPMPLGRRPGSGNFIEIRGARENNLKNIDVSIPLGQFVCITGVSGSGKSTLITEILHKKAAQVLYSRRERPAGHGRLLGLQHRAKVTNGDQSR